MTTGPKLSEALNRARARGRVWQAERLADPDMLTANQLAQRLGVSADAVDDLRQHNRVLALTLLGETRYPAWQVRPDGTLLPAIDQVVARLNGSPLTVYRLLMSAAHDGTDRRLHEQLAVGDIDGVLGQADAWANGAFT
ncbi:MAG: hypothetical protein ACU0E9_12015 [Limimaricola soesokkakensis]|uniref:hypothetical protein n=1 Tax=Limimaricola soesokkakensis TaxID=1343159 RepID=UPI0040590463